MNNIFLDYLLKEAIRIWSVLNPIHVSSTEKFNIVTDKRPKTWLVYVMISFHVSRYNNKIECEVISSSVSSDSALSLISDVVLTTTAVLASGCLFDFPCYFTPY